MRPVCIFLFGLLGLFACVGHTQSFDNWLTDFKKEAAAKGISQSVLMEAFADVHAPVQDVLDRDQAQPENTKTFEEYETGLITDRKITDGRGNWKTHQELLGRIEKTYGVQTPILLALWGIESNYGARQGDYSIIASLATLAYDGRRSQFFRGELLSACLILQQEGRTADTLTGSWAGAMGQIQFMPSSYLNYAVDFDGDGKRDIWTSDADALASMANYLSKKGWVYGEGWGMRVLLPEKSEIYWEDMKDPLPLKRWQMLGVRLPDGTNLPQKAISARLILPDDEPDIAFLVFPNYNVLLQWNRSTYFATAVGLLADAIKQ